MSDGLEKTLNQITMEITQKAQDILNRQLISRNPDYAAGLIACAINGLLSELINNGQGQNVRLEISGEQTSDNEQETVEANDTYRISALIKRAIRAALKGNNFSLSLESKN